MRVSKYAWADLIRQVATAMVAAQSSAVTKGPEGFSWIGPFTFLNPLAPGGGDIHHGSPGLGCRKDPSPGVKELHSVPSRARDARWRD